MIDWARTIDWVKITPNWVKCLFGFHSHSDWMEHEETAGLGSYSWQSRFCCQCGRTQRRS